MLRHPAILEQDTNNTIRVEFPDVPEANTFGEDQDGALMHGVDALETALSMYIEDRRDIPKPSPRRRRQGAVLHPSCQRANWSRRVGRAPKTLFPTLSGTNATSEARPRTRPYRA